MKRVSIATSAPVMLDGLGKGHYHMFGRNKAIKTSNESNQHEHIHTALVANTLVYLNPTYGLEHRHEIVSYIPDELAENIERRNAHAPTSS